MQENSTKDPGSSDGQPEAFRGVSLEALWKAIPPRPTAIVSAVVVTLVVASALMLILGVNPLEAYKQLFLGAFGDATRISAVLVKATPLILVALGIAVAFRCQLWNVGAEGQLYMGGIAATVVGILAAGVPAPLMIPLCIGVAMVGGALWGAIPGVLKARFNANEVLVTIMLNYVAILAANMVITGAWRHPIVPKTIDIQEAAFLPVLWSPGRLHSGVLIALAAAVLTGLLLFRTVLGYQIRATGHSLTAALYAGIRVNRIMVLAFSISGALAGLAGGIQILGVHHNLVDGFSPGYGFTGIVVALLGRLHPLWIVVSGVLLAALLVGSDWMQVVLGIPVAMVNVIQGVLVLVILAVGMLRP